MVVAMMRRPVHQEDSLGKEIGGRGRVRSSRASITCRRRRRNTARVSMATQEFGSEAQAVTTCVLGMKAIRD